MNALASNPTSIMRNRGIIQLAKAVEVALGEPWSMCWEAFASAERMLMLSARDTRQSISSQIQDLINRSVIWRTQNQGTGHEPFNPRCHNPFNCWVFLGWGKFQKFWLWRSILIGRETFFERSNCKTLFIMY